MCNGLVHLLLRLIRVEFHWKLSTSIFHQFHFVYSLHGHLHDWRKNKKKQMCWKCFGWCLGLTSLLENYFVHLHNLILKLRLGAAKFCLLLDVVISYSFLSFYPFVFHLKLWYDDQNCIFLFYVHCL